MKRGSFDPGLVAWRDRQAADPDLPVLDPADSDAVWAAALSVAIGDFDGDSTRDVAMEGIAGDKFVAFFLLSPSDSSTGPKLLYFRRPVEGTWTQSAKSFIDYFTLVRPGEVTGFAEDADDLPVLKLHHDAIDFGIFEKASEL